MRAVRLHPGTRPGVPGRLRFPVFPGPCLWPRQPGLPRRRLPALQPRLPQIAGHAVQGGQIFRRDRSGRPRRGRSDRCQATVRPRAAHYRESWGLRCSAARACSPLAASRLGPGVSQRGPEARRHRQRPGARSCCSAAWPLACRPVEQRRTTMSDIVTPAGTSRSP